jgi:diguanylate cyclase (GGDEF)-like protein
MSNPEQLRRVIAAQQALLEIDDVDQALAATCEHARALTGATGAVVELATDDELLYEACSGSLAPYRGLRLQRLRSMSGLCIETGEPLSTPDGRTDPRCDQAACRRLDVASMICVPLPGSTSGVLKVVSSAVAAFSDADVEILAMFADTASRRLAQARRRSVARIAVLPPAPDAEARLLPAIMSSIQDLVVVIDLSGRVVLVNEAARSVIDRGTRTQEIPLFGSQSGQPLDDAHRPLLRCLRGETVRGLELSVRTKDGSLRWLSVNASPLRNEHGTIQGAVSISRDVTELRLAREALAAAAVHDEMTGLLNRRGFLERGGAALRLADRSGRGVGVLYIDLNEMKTINDQLGHAMGDAVLCELADTLRDAVRSTDLVSRLGGDEYVVLAIDCDTPAEVATVQARVEAAIAERASRPGRRYPLSASIGAMHYAPRTGRRGIDELLGEADQRMYEAKQRKKAARTARLTLVSG